MSLHQDCLKSTIISTLQGGDEQKRLQLNHQTTLYHTPTYIFSNSKVLKDIKFMQSICKLHQMCSKKAGSEKKPHKGASDTVEGFYFIMGLKIKVCWALIWDPINNSWLFLLSISFEIIYCMCFTLSR